MSGFKRLLEAEGERGRRPATLADLAAEGLDVFCWCNRCGHNAVVSTALLIRQLGPAQTVPDIGARMCCTGCASRDIATRPHWPNDDGPVTRHG